MPVPVLFSYVAVSAGIIFFLAGALGLLRFPDSLSRLHALTKADNLGLALIVVGLAPLVGDWRIAAKLVLIWLLLLLGSAVSAQLIGRIAGAGTPRD